MVFDLLANLAVLVVFAWGVRGLLGAREVTWPRMALAVLAGQAAGGSIAAFLVLDFDALRDQATAGEAITVSGGQLLALALPFQVVMTMAAVVVLELVSASPRRRGDLRPIRPVRALRHRVGVGARLLEVLRIVARHGLAPALGLRRGDVSTRSPGELARRARAALEDAGGMFVKLGQLLATRPDLLPPDALAELSRLHATARPLAPEEVRAVLAAEVGDVDEVFAEVDWVPLGSASIAQAHRARLRDGRDVVVKVRRPGLEAVVERDLAIVRWLARVAQRRTPWGRAYQVAALADAFGEALRAELDFRLEARAAAEVATAVARHPRVRVPWVDEALTTPRVLVMEHLSGRPLTAVGPAALGDDGRALADALCASQVGAMLQGEAFHGDPHPGNVLLMGDGTLGLVDFGVSGKLDTFERDAMFQMLLAIQLRQPTLLYESLVVVGALEATRDPQEIERALARFMAAHLGPGLPPADALVELLRVTTRLGVRLPPQASTMFRALATLAGTLEHLSPGYPIIDEVAALGGTEVRERLAPSSIGELVQQEWAQLGPLARRAPRHLDRIATQLQHGSLTTRVRLFADPADVNVAERLVNRLVLTVMALGVGLLSVLMLGTEAGPELAGARVRLLEVLGWIGLFAGTVLLLRVLLAALRSEVADRDAPT